MGLLFPEMGKTREGTGSGRKGRSLVLKIFSVGYLLDIQVEM